MKELPEGYTLEQAYNDILFLAHRNADLHARIDMLHDLYFDEAHQVKMVDIIEMDYRMEELEGKYGGVMKYLSGRKENQLQKAPKYD